MSYAGYFKKNLEAIHAEHRYRILRVQHRDSAFPQTWIEGFDYPITTWCGVDYLGFSQHPILKKAMQEAIDRYGVGAGGTRTIGGTHVMHMALEKRLAHLHGKEAALLFNTGYIANQSTLSSLSKIVSNLVFLSDAENHMSIIEGIREARTSKIIFRHNDLADLEEKLAELSIEQPKLIVFESVYSMSGDIAPTPEIVALAKKYNAMTFLDEVHAVGIYGKTGAGVSELHHTARDLTFIQGTLGKSFGLFGGYIAGDREAIDAIRLNAHGFIFTTSLPPPLCAAAISAIDYRATHPQEAETLLTLTENLKRNLKAAGLPVLPSASQIIPILVGDSKRCQDIANRLLQEFHLYVQAVNYPTVRRGLERLRISPTALHTPKMATELVHALQKCFFNEH